MCGICGIFVSDRNQRVDPAALSAMNGRLLHRGPDDEGFYVQENVGLAMRRLSIIDLQTGHQPICNEDKSAWLVYNGELYNHQQLRNGLEAQGHRYQSKSDTETIVHLYEEKGRDCVKRMRGMFAFAVFNRHTRTLLLARDRLGIKPLYYFFDGHTLLFASEIKALLAYPGLKAQFNEKVLAEYLAFGYIAGPETMFADIKKLLPGHTLELSEKGELNIQSYWEPSGSEPLPLSEKQCVHDYRELLEESVSLHLMSDVPLGVFLSGGLDSSAIAALATKLRGEPLETFSVGYREEAYSELPFAREVAKFIGSNHREVLVSREQFFEALPRLIWQEDEPLVWPSSVALYFTARLAREHVKVVLTGEGSDETLGGYSRYAWTLANARMDRGYRAITPNSLRSIIRSGIVDGPWPEKIRRRLEHTFLGRDGESWSSFYFDNFYSAFSGAEQRDLLREESKISANDPYESSMAQWENAPGDLLHRMLNTDIKTYLVELLMKQDQMSMAASVESRVPFLDHVLVEFAATIPAQHLIKGMAGKAVLKSAVKGLLPESIIHRKKLGFPTPWACWLDGPQLEELERILTTKANERGYFRSSAIERLFTEHRARRRDNSTRLWRLLNLEIWMSVFIDESNSFASFSNEPAGNPAVKQPRVASAKVY